MARQTGVPLLVDSFLPKDEKTLMVNMALSHTAVKDKKMVDKRIYLW